MIEASGLPRLYETFALSSNFREIFVQHSCLAHSDVFPCALRAGWGLAAIFRRRHAEL